MDFIKQPMDIENKSMEIIAPHLAGLNLSEAETKVYSRMIHASGDVDYAKVIRLHPKAIEATQEALKRGANIYTDVEMVRTGVNKKAFGRYGGKIECRVADPEIAEIAKREGITRSMAAMRAFGKDLAGSIVAIGNAPTALIRLRELIDEGYRPKLIIGVPVGFVNVVVSKELIMETDVPCIVARGRKGGSNVAACIVNAILYTLDEKRGE